MKKVALLLICLIIGFLPSVSAVFVSTGEWYTKLDKPPLNPPAWVFGPAWTILYLLIGLSLFLFLCKDVSWKDRRTGIVLFTLQHLLNFSWTPVFFHFHSMIAAFAIILAMLVLIALTAWNFYRHSHASGILMVPYLAWVLFASYLNLSLILLNR